MRASNIALLFLAASAAAPVFSAPLYTHARSDPPTSNSEISTSLSPDEERPLKSILTSRDDDDSSTHFNLGETRDFTPDQLATRDHVDNLVAGLLTSRDFNANYNPTVHDRTFTHFVLSRDNELQARSGIKDFFKGFAKGFIGVFKLAAKVVGTVASLVLRDATPDELAARDDVAGFIALRNAPQAKTTRDSDDASNIRFSNALLRS